MGLEKFGFGKKKEMPEFEKAKADLKAAKEAPMIALGQELYHIRSAVTESFINMDSKKMNRGEENYSSTIDREDLLFSDGLKTPGLEDSRMGLPGVLERLAAKGITRSTNELVKQLDNLNTARQELLAFRDSVSLDHANYVQQRDELKKKVSDLTKETQDMLPKWELLLTGAV